MGGGQLSQSERVAGLDRKASWDGIHAVVIGFDEAGISAADNLLFLGATVTAIDPSLDPRDPDRVERADLLRQLGAVIALGEEASPELPASTDLVIVGPGWRPDAALVAQAAERGVAIWSDAELAWRLREPGPGGSYVPWIALTGARGAGAAAAMLDSILQAAGLRSAAIGVSGQPLVEAVMDPTPHDVLAVELGHDQLHFSSSLVAESGAVLSHPAEPAWYVGWGTAQDYADDVGRVYRDNAVACVYQVAEPATRELVEGADVREGARGIGVSLGMPSVGMLGLVEDILVDRAFIQERTTSAAELCTLADLGTEDPDVVGYALVAAALARAHGVSQQAVRDGLRAIDPDRLPGLGRPAT